MVSGHVTRQVLSGPGQHASMRGNSGQGTPSYGCEDGRPSRPLAPRASTGRPIGPCGPTTRRALLYRKAPCMRHATEHADLAAVTDVATDVATAELESVLRGGPFHVALRAAIAARGLPLQRVQHHLSRYGVKVGVTSLSYWQQGARRPQRPESLRAVRALEEILQLPDESLIRLLARADEPPDRNAPPAARTAPSWRPPACWNGSSPNWTCRSTAVSTPSATTSASASARTGSCWAASPSTSCAPTGTAWTAMSPSITATRAARLSGWPSAPWRTAAPGGCAGTRRPASSSPNSSSTPGCAAATRSSSATASTTARPVSAPSTSAASAPRGPVRPPGPLRRTGSAPALPPLQPALRRGPPQRPADPPLSGLHRSVHLVEPRVRPGIVGIGWDWE